MIRKALSREPESFDMMNEVPIPLLDEVRFDLMLPRMDGAACFRCKPAGLGDGVERNRRKCDDRS
jgi:hypothetical protein